MFGALSPAGIFYPLFVILVAAGLFSRWNVRRRIGVARWDHATRLLERLALTGLLLTMLSFAVLQIILRNAFQTGLVWIEPLLRHLVLWIGFTAAVVAAGRLRHIQMDVIGRLLPEKGRVFTARLTTLAAAVICMVLARAAWIYLGQEREFGSEGFLGLPNWLLTSVIFLGFALMAKRFVARALLPAAALIPMLDDEPGVELKSEEELAREMAVPDREEQDDAP